MFKWRYRRWFKGYYAISKDFYNKEVGAYRAKYLQGIASVTTKNRMKILRLIENMWLGTTAVDYRTESMHGVGSPTGTENNDTKTRLFRTKEKTSKDYS